MCARFLKWTWISKHKNSPNISYLKWLGLNSLFQLSQNCTKRKGCNGVTIVQKHGSITTSYSLKCTGARWDKIKRGVHLRVGSSLEQYSQSLLRKFFFSQTFYGSCFLMFYSITTPNCNLISCKLCHEKFVMLYCTNKTLIISPIFSEQRYFWVYYYIYSLFELNWIELNWVSYFNTINEILY